MVQHFAGPKGDTYVDLKEIVAIEPDDAGSIVVLRGGAKVAVPLSPKELERLIRPPAKASGFM
jgi:hypothetical protein